MVDEEKKSPIGNFYELLNIKKQKKKNLIFCVMTQYDQHYKKKENNKKLVEKWKKFFDEKEMSFMWNNTLLWVSEPKYDLEDF